MNAANLHLAWCRAFCLIDIAETKAAQALDATPAGCEEIPLRVRPVIVATVGMWLAQVAEVSRVRI